MTKMDRRSFLRTAGTLGALSLAGHLALPTPSFATSKFVPGVGEKSLRERARAKGLLFGSAIQARQLSDGPFRDTFARECSILVPEVELKWDVLHSSPGSYNFSAADTLMSYAKQNHMQFRGHPLVWHQKLPDWVRPANSREAERILVDHVRAVVGHFAGAVHSWDVVNEAVLAQNKRPDSLRRTVWLDLLGPRYLDIAFHAAAEADPAAMLVYNETHLESDSRWSEANRETTLKLLQKMISSGVRVQAVGLQSHLRMNADESSFNFKLNREFVRNLAGLGLKVIVTELDVNDDGLPSDPSARDQAVASLYYDYLSALLENRAVIAVMTWGLTDKYSWVAKQHQDGNQGRPLPLDSHLMRKPAWEAIGRAIDEAPGR